MSHVAPLGMIEKGNVAIVVEVQEHLLSLKLLVLLLLALLHRMTAGSL